MIRLAKIRRCWRAVTRDVTAGVTILGVLALPALIGAVGLTVDISRGYQQRVSNQRAADMAALAAAMAYVANPSTSVLQPTAADLVLANGVNGATTTAALVNNYPTAGKTAVKVTVTRPVEIYLGAVLGVGGTFNVNAAAYAQIGSNSAPSAPCYLALSSASNAIALSGNAVINAPSCAVAAVGGISQGGELISAQDVIAGTGSVAVGSGILSVVDYLYYAGSFTFPSGNTAVPAPSQRKNQTTTLADPWASNSDITSATALLGTFTAVPTLTNPVTSNGPSWSVGGSSIGTVAQYKVSGTNNFVIPAGNYVLNTLTVANGYNLTFQNGSNITINGGVSIGNGCVVNFGNSNVYVNGGFNSGSSSVTFGDGVLWIGSGTIKFAGTNVKGAGDVTINGTMDLANGATFAMGTGTHNFGRITMGSGGRMKLGTGNFQASNGIALDGDSELALGAGNILLGKFTDGNSIVLKSSARSLMGDGPFSASGHIMTDGGTRLAFGAATNHLINGNLSIKGSALFGAGRYTINGNFVNGTDGTSWPYTVTWPTAWSAGTQTWGSGTDYSGYDMAGINVTFVMSGSLNLGGGAISHLEAPTTTTSGGAIAQLLLTSTTSGATTWGAGSSNKFGGVVHVPNSAVTMSGGNATVGGTACFSLVANTITVSGGAQTGTACGVMSNAFSGGGRGSVRLVN